MALTEQCERQEDSTTSSPGWISATIGSKGQDGADRALNLESENQGSNLSLLVDGMTWDELFNVPGPIQKLGIPMSSRPLTCLWWRSEQVQSGNVHVLGQMP